MSGNNRYGVADNFSYPSPTGFQKSKGETYAACIQQTIA
jgi:hypothetical protein